MYPSMFDVQSLAGPGLPKGTSILYLQLVLLRSQEVPIRIKSAFVRATKVASTTQRALQHCTKHTFLGAFTKLSRKFKFY